MVSVLKFLYIKSVTTGHVVVGGSSIKILHVQIQFTFLSELPFYYHFNSWVPSCHCQSYITSPTCYKTFFWSSASIGKSFISLFCLVFVMQIFETILITCVLHTHKSKIAQSFLTGKFVTPITLVLMTVTETISKT